MRTREKTYEDYGYTRDQANEAKLIARKKDLSIQEKLLIACNKAKPELSDELFYAIRMNLSYEDVCRSREVPISRNDWYPYIVKAVCMFADLL